jgi:hypothetical protein
MCFGLFHSFEVQIDVVVSVAVANSHVIMTENGLGKPVLFIL